MFPVVIRAVGVAIAWMIFCARPGVAVGADLGLERLTLAVSGHPTAIWARRPSSPVGTVVLVHGRTWSARTAFDFEPQAGSRSLLRALASAGFATYAVDLPGYGETPRDDSGWLRPTQAAEIVEAVVKFAGAQYHGLPAPVLLGWSRGSKIAALVATRGLQRVSGLVLYGFTFDPASPPRYGPATGDPPAVANSEADARSDFISPDVIDGGLVQEFTTKALKLDRIKADVCCDSEFLGIDPAAIQIPTMLIQGARDPGIRQAAAAEFFAKLGTNDRRWIVIASGDHAVGLEATAPVFFGAIMDFARSAIAPAALAR